MQHRSMRLLALLCLAVFLWVPGAQAAIYINEEPPADWQERELMRVTQFMLSACDGMLLEVGGQTMLIDGGTSGFIKDMQAYLGQRNITHVDYLFNTHPHNDHIDCQYYLVKRGLTAGQFLTAFREGFPLKEHRRMVSLLKQKEIPFHQLNTGDTMQMGNATLTFIQAPEGDPNMRSCMTHIRYGDSTMLLTADITGKVQHYFLENVDPQLLDVQILKEPHHGLVHMVGDFVDAVSPEFVFITNRISTTPKATNQLKKRNIPCLYSALGYIVLETDGTDWYIHQVKGK